MTTSRRSVLAGCALAVAALVPGRAAFCEEERVPIGAGSVNGPFYVAANAIGKVWKRVGRQPSVEITPGSIHNSSLLHRGEVRTALISQGVVWESWHSVGLFKRQERHTKVRAAIPLYLSYMHGWSRPEAGIAAYRDLAGRTVCAGPSGSASDAWVRRMVGAIGTPAKRYVTASYADTVGLLRGGTIDAASASGEVPMGPATEALTTLKARIFGLRHPEDVEKTIAAMPFLQSAELPARTYPGQNEPITTVADWNAYFVNQDLNEELVYAFTRTAFESRDLLTSISPALRAVQPEHVRNIMLPLHRGAYRYYQERGIPVADTAKPID